MKTKFSGDITKIITKLYKSLQDRKLENTQYNKWEMEGPLEILEKDWSNILKSQWKTTHSSTWREFGWKNVTRFFSHS